MSIDKQLISFQNCFGLPFRFSQEKGYDGFSYQIFMLVTYCIVESVACEVRVKQACGKFSQNGNEPNIPQHAQLLG